MSDTLCEMKAEAADRLTAARSMASAANALPTHEQRIAAYREMPRPVAMRGDVSVAAMIPQNRIVWRRQHVRFVYRVAGKLVGETAARAAIAQAEG